MPAKRKKSGKRAEFNPIPFAKGAAAGAAVMLAGLALTLLVVRHEREGVEPPRLPYEEPLRDVEPVRRPAPAVDLSSAKWGTRHETETAARPQMAPPSPAFPETAPTTAAPGVPNGPAGEEPAWRRFAVAADDAPGRPMIAVVIDDLGVDKARSARAIALPAPLTLAFLPYARELPRQTRAARSAGHELLVHMPMEPESPTVDPGPDALLTELPADENLRRLRENLARFQGYVGINNHMGSRFTSDRAALEPVLAELKARGLLFLDSRTTPRSASAGLAHMLGLPYADRQVFLDNDQSADEVHARLSETERIARESGFAIAIGHPHDGTLQALSEWIPTARERGFALVPVSAIVRRTLAAGGAVASGRSGAPPERAPN
ncbi:MAG: divergent polysaccharide deacetylase family protein [Alphaproteobacteria bacterium]